MISDIGPGMRMLVEFLEKAPDDHFQHTMLFPNGYVVSIIRKKPERIEIPGFNPQLAGGSYGGADGFFEMALINGKTDEMVGNPEGWMAPVDCARKAREWYELPHV